MAKFAVLFTGQGAQSPGMGKDVADANAKAAAVFERANAVLGYDLRDLCFNGPADKLEQTDIQQPAIFTTSVAIWEALGGMPAFGEPATAMAGLSLGEYTALFAAGSVAFEDALKLVQRRGQLMQEAARAVPSGMVSAMGLDPDRVDQICDQARGDDVLVPANYNCPGQVVLSGSRGACERAAPLIEEAGGRAIPLKVAGAFHSPLMAPAANGLADVLTQTDFSAPNPPVVANVNCENHQDAATIRQWLTDQLTHPVRWQASIERLMTEGVERFVEIGPGRILTGLMKKIARRTPMVNISTAEDLAKAESALAG